MLPDSLQTPFGVQCSHITTRPKAEFDGTGRDGRDGTDGTDGPQKCPLIFFILRYIKHYTHIYLNIYKKKFRTNFLWVLNFGQKTSILSKLYHENLYISLGEAGQNLCLIYPDFGPKSHEFWSKSS